MLQPATNCLRESRYAWRVISDYFSWMRPSRCFHSVGQDDVADAEDRVCCGARLSWPRESCTVTQRLGSIFGSQGFLFKRGL